MNIIILLLTFSIQLVFCRDFYLGMFKRNDYLVAQDNIYKGAMPYTFTYAKYGRIFKCPITYFRVVDRLGMGRGPTVELIRGGLGKKFVVARIKSPYNLPVSVNIYVGCENKNKAPVWKRPTTHATTRKAEAHATTRKPEAHGHVEHGGESGSGSGSGAGAAGEHEGKKEPEGSGKKEPEVDAKKEPEGSGKKEPEGSGKKEHEEKKER